MNTLYIPITGVYADGSRVWYTGKAGSAFVSPNPKEAFLGYYLEGAQRCAARLNKMTALHGIRFIACQGDLYKEVTK